MHIFMHGGHGGHGGQGHHQRTELKRDQSDGGKP
jgi:hypothetical protein